jgi:hypothetical protein
MIRLKKIKVKGEGCYSTDQDKFQTCPRGLLLNLILEEGHGDNKKMPPSKVTAMTNPTNIHTII